MARELRLASAMRETQISVFLLLLLANLACAQARAADGGLYAPRTDWTSFSGGKINISGFVFRDVNRNGIYDLADWPMENVAVQVTSYTGKKSLRWTNSNGFANFGMSVRQTKVDIPNPGEYVFDVMVPDGWTVTTDNRRQAKQFRLLPGSVADMVADPPFVAVGLAPDLVIQGRIAEAGPGIEISVTDPSGSSRVVTPRADGQFSIPASTGSWIVRARKQGVPESVERTVAVKNVPVQMSMIEFGKPVPPQRPNPTVVDFESVTPKPIREMPNGVGGLRWWNMVALQVAPSYTNGVQSGAYIAYNSSGHPARIYLDKGFDFAGGYFSVAWARANGETLHLDAWKGDKLTYSDKIQLSNLGAVWFDADYRDITRLDIYSEHYWQFVSDDLSFRLGP